MNYKKNDGSTGVRAVERALDVLLCFNWNEKELTLTDISEKLGLAKSTVSRMLATLEMADFVYRDPKTNMYRLGSNIYYLGQIAKASMDLRNVAYPIMQELNNVTQETINLYLLDNLDRVCFEQIESPHTLKQVVKIGDRFPLWDGATGRVLLANLDEALWYDMIKELKPLTESTITDPIKFIESLKETKALGYAVSIGEKNYDIGCVAAPIFESTGKVKGCISISGPRFRIPQNTDQYAHLVVEAAKKISNQLGFFR